MASPAHGGQPPSVTGSKAAVADMLTHVRQAIILLHVNADGDSVGSSLALAHALEKRGGRCWVVYGDRFPETFRFLPGAERIVAWHDVPAGLAFDAAILPDSAAVDRIGAATDLLPRAERIINIDHHRSNPGFGDVFWVDPTRACVGEMILELLDELDVPLDEAIALCLYTAIVTDTGNFQYENTTAATHRAAARLLELHVSPPLVAQHLYESRSLAALRLLGDVLATLECTEDGRIAWVRVDKAMRQHRRATPQDSEGIVNIPRSLAGVEVALAFHEQDDGSIRVALRSKRTVDVAKIAEHFGGGGHARAAGCRVDPPLAKAIDRVVATAASHLPEQGSNRPQHA